MLALALDTLNRLRYKLPSRPTKVQIEITNRCNMDCPMCPREDLPLDLEHMDWDLFTRVVGDLRNREEITLTGWGEPFLHPRVFDMIAYCKQRGHSVSITSNGLFPKPDFAEKIIASGLDQLTFSIDSVDAGVERGHNNPHVYRNIETLARLRTRGLPALRLQATLHAGCATDLYEVIRYGAMLGIDIVNVGRLDRKYAPDLKRPGPMEEARIFGEADRLARSLGIQLDWLQFAVSRGLTRIVYRLLRKKLHRSGRYCLKTYDNVYVGREGHVTPCCLLPQAPMGHLQDSSLEEVWHNDRFRHFRDHYRDVCGSCDLWTIDQVDGNGCR